MLNVLVRERQQVTQAMDRVYDLYIDGQISAEGFGGQVQALGRASQAAR